MHCRDDALEVGGRPLKRAKTDIHTICQLLSVVDDASNPPCKRTKNFDAPPGDSQAPLIDGAFQDIWSPVSTAQPLKQSSLQKQRRAGSPLPRVDKMLSTVQTPVHSTPAPAPASRQSKPASKSNTSVPASSAPTRSRRTTRKENDSDSSPVQHVGEWQLLSVCDLI